MKTRILILLLVSSCTDQIKYDSNKMVNQKFRTLCVDGFVYYTWHGANRATNITPKIGQGGVFITCGETQKDGL